jgi:hypothetical protein
MFLVAIAFQVFVTALQGYLVAMAGQNCLPTQDETLRQQEGGLVRQKQLPCAALDVF